MFQRSLASLVVVLLLSCSSVFAADRYSYRKNVHGGVDIYVNGRYNGRTVPNAFGGQKYYLKGARQFEAPRYRGYSVPQANGNGGQYFFNSPSTK